MFLLLLLEAVYFLPMAWGWHAVPFHLFNRRFTGVNYRRALPPELNRMPGNDATAVLMDYPNEYYTASNLRRGRLPLWNPRIGMGRAWTGNAQVHPFSPLLLPFLLHPTPWTYTLQFLLGSLACLLGAFWLFRLMGCSLLPAAAGAALWTWNPFTSASFIMSSVWAYWWMPLALGGLLWSLKHKRREGWAVAAASFALMVLCGQPETALILGEMAGFFVLSALLGAGPRRLSTGKTLLGCGAAALLALALSAAQWGPILEVLRDAVWYKGAGIAHAAALTHPLSTFFQPASGVFLQPVLWASLCLLLLGRLRWETAAFGVMLLFCLGFTVPAVFGSIPYRVFRLGGLVPPLHGAELACVPMAGLFALGTASLLDRDRSPFSLDRAAAALVCLGLTGWAILRLPLGRGGSWQSAAWLVLACGLFLLAAFLPRPRRGRALALLVAAAVCLPLAFQGFLYPYFGGSSQPDWTSLFSGEAKTGLPPARFWAQSSAGTGAPYLAPNLNLLAGGSDLRSSSVLNPPGSDLFSHGWGPGGYISHLTYTFSAADPGFLSFLGVDRAVLARDKPGTLFAVAPIHPGPRAFFAPEVEVVDDDRRALERFKTLLELGQIYRTAVISTGAPVQRPGTIPRDAGAPAAGDDLTWLAYSPRRLALRVEAPSAGILVVLDSFTRLWRARVDGRPAPMLRTDVIFRGVPLEAGTHEVEMAYDSGLMVFAMLFSLLAWLGVGGWFFWLWVKKRSNPGGTEET